MKILEGQSHRHLTGLTTVALDSLTEANGLVHAALGDEKFLKKSYDECMKIVRANQRYSFHNDFSIKRYRESLQESLKQIEHGNPAINEKASALAEEFTEAAKLIEPSLSHEETYQPAEDGELYDAGKIASDDPMAFFKPQRNNRPRSGKGDGCFRILINTDVAWWMDPTVQTAGLMALVLLLQRQAPVEIWIQQGWLGRASNDGITLFKIFSGGMIEPRSVFFWIGSVYKDSPYSYTVNKMLHRNSSCVSLTPEIPCDLYIYGSWMPDLKSAQFPEWVAHTARQMLFDEEMPDGWTGWRSTFKAQS